MQQKFFRINNQIKANELRVIDSRGKQIGILSLEKALKVAEDAGLDLVEIAPTVTPPVAKIQDLRKFLFEQKIKEKKKTGKTKEIETKEIRVRPFISDHDLQTRMNQARKFLTEGNNFKLTVHFTPRQMRHTEFANKILEKVSQALSQVGQIAREPRWEGRRLTVIFSKK